MRDAKKFASRYCAPRKVLHEIKNKHVSGVLLLVAVGVVRFMLCSAPSCFARYIYTDLEKPCLCAIPSLRGLGHPPLARFEAFARAPLTRPAALIVLPLTSAGRSRPAATASGCRPKRCCAFAEETKILCSSCPLLSSHFCIKCCGIKGLFRVAGLACRLGVG